MYSYLLLAAIIVISCSLINKLSVKTGLPTLLVFIILGMISGSDGLLKIPFDNYDAAEFICSTALIFIIFFGGFGTNWTEARPVAVKSALLSTLGVVVTAALTGAFCHFILGMQWVMGLLIGSVISSTDAASVFFILRSKKLGLKDRTASMLEVESGSNDPCSYMLTVIMLAVMTGGTDTGSIVEMLFTQFVYGIGFGIVIALVGRFILRHVHFSVEGFDMAFVAGIALLSYALPSLVNGNGYLSTYLVGIILGNSRIANKKGLVNFFEGFTGLMQMLLFFLLGLLAMPSLMPDVLLPALSIALFLTFVARPVAVFAILTPLRCSLPQQLLVSFVGLRGAASIVFAVMVMATHADIHMDIFHIVFCIVLLSILFQGSLLAPAAKLLNMTDKDIPVMKTFTDYQEEFNLQFIKLSITENHPWKDKPVRELSLPPDTLIVMVLRGLGHIIPNGSTVLEQGDIIALTAPGFQTEKDLRLVRISITPDSPWKGKDVATFAAEDNRLIMMIKRQDKVLIPHGSTILQQDDILVINEI